MKTVYKNHGFGNLLLPGETAQGADQLMAQGASQDVKRKEEIR